jgi:hypothetical protein
MEIEDVQPALRPIRSPPNMKRGQAVRAKPALAGVSGRGLRATRGLPKPGQIGIGNDLEGIVAALAHDVEQLDLLIESQRPVIENAGRHGSEFDREAARQRWSTIRTSAMDIAERAHDAIAQVTQNLPAE